MKSDMRTPWRRWRFRLNAFLLLLPAWYLYSAMYPHFPPAWPERQVGPFTATPTPQDEGPPYRYGDLYLKDFSVRLCDGCLGLIRAGYLNIGKEPLAVSEQTDGVLHGNLLLQEAHAVAPAHIGPGDNLWITLQEWNGRVHHSAWEIQ